MVGGSKNGTAAPSGSAPAADAPKTGTGGSDKKPRQASDANSPGACSRGGPKLGGRCPECSRVNSGKWYRHKTRDGEYTCDGCYRFFKTNSHYKHKSAAPATAPAAVRTSAGGAVAGTTAAGSDPTTKGAKPASATATPASQDPAGPAARALGTNIQKAAAEGSSLVAGQSATDAIGGSAGVGAKRKQPPQEQGAGTRQKRAKQEQDHKEERAMDGGKKRQAEEGGKAAGQSEKGIKPKTEGQAGGSCADDGGDKGSPEQDAATEPANKLDGVATGVAAADANPRRRAAAVAAARGIAKCSARGGLWPKGGSSDGSGAQACGAASAAGTGTGNVQGGGEGATGIGSKAQGGEGAAGAAGGKAQGGGAITGGAAGSSKAQGGGVTTGGTAGSSKAQGGGSLGGAAATAMARRKAFLQSVGELKCCHCGNKESRRWCRHRLLKDGHSMTCERCDDYFRRHGAYAKNTRKISPAAAAPGPAEAAGGAAAQERAAESGKGAAEAVASAMGPACAGEERMAAEETRSEPVEASKEGREAVEEEHVDKAAQAVEATPLEEATAVKAASPAAEEVKAVGETVAVIKDTEVGTETPPAVEEGADAALGEAAAPVRDLPQEEAEGKVVEAEGEAAASKAPEPATETGGTEPMVEVEETEAGEGEKTEAEDEAASEAVKETEAGEREKTEAEEGSTAEEEKDAGESALTGSAKGLGTGSTEMEGSEAEEKEVDEEQRKIAQEEEPAPQGSAGAAPTMTEAPAEAKAEAMADLPGPDKQANQTGPESAQSVQEVPAAGSEEPKAAAESEGSQPAATTTAPATAHEHADVAPLPNCEAEPEAQEVAAAATERAEENPQASDEQLVTAGPVGPAEDEGRSELAAAAVIRGPTIPVAGATVGAAQGAQGAASTADGATATPASELEADAATREEGGEGRTREEVEAAVGRRVAATVTAGAATGFEAKAEQAAGIDVVAVAVAAAVPAGEPGAVSETAAVQALGLDAVSVGPTVSPADGSQLDAAPGALAAAAATAAAGSACEDGQGGARGAMAAPEASVEAVPSETTATTTATNTPPALATSTLLPVAPRGAEPSTAGAVRRDGFPPNDDDVASVPRCGMEGVEGGAVKSAEGTRQAGAAAAAVAAPVAPPVKPGSGPRRPPSQPKPPPPPLPPQAKPQAQEPGKKHEDSGQQQQRKCSACGSTHTQSGWRRHQGGEVGKVVCKRCYDWHYRHGTYERGQSVPRAGGAAAAAGAAATGANSTLAQRRPRRTASNPTAAAAAAVVSPAPAPVGAEAVAGAAPAVAAAAQKPALEAVPAAETAAAAADDAVGPPSKRRRMQRAAEEQGGCAATATAAAAASPTVLSARATPMPQRQAPAIRMVAIAASGAEEGQRGGDAGSQGRRVEGSATGQPAGEHPDDSDNAASGQQNLEADSPVLLQSYVKAFGDALARACKALVELEDQYGIRLLDVPVPLQQQPPPPPPPVALTGASAAAFAAAAAADAAAKDETPAPPARSALRLFYERVCGNDTKLRSRHLADVVVRWLELNAWRSPLALLLGPAASGTMPWPDHRRAGAPDNGVAGAPQQDTDSQGALDGGRSGAQQRSGSAGGAAAADAAAPTYKLGLAARPWPQPLSAAVDRFRQVVESLALNMAQNLLGLIPPTGARPLSRPQPQATAGTPCISSRAGGGPAVVTTTVEAALPQSAATATITAADATAAAAHAAAAMPHLESLAAAALHLAHRVGAAAAPGRLALRLAAPGDLIPLASAPGRPRPPAAAVSLKLTSPTCGEAEVPEAPGCCSAVTPVEWVCCGVKGEGHDEDDSAAVAKDADGRHLRLAHLLRSLYDGGMAQWQDSHVALSWEEGPSAPLCMAASETEAVAATAIATVASDGQTRARGAGGGGAASAGPPGAPAVLWVVSPGIVRRELRMISGAKAAAPPAVAPLPGLRSAVTEPRSGTNTPALPPGPTLSTAAASAAVSAATAAAPPLLPLVSGQHAVATEVAAAAEAADAVCAAVATALARGDQDALLGATEAAAAVVLQLVRVMSSKDGCFASWATKLGLPASLPAADSLGVASPSAVSGGVEWGGGGAGTARKGLLLQGGGGGEGPLQQQPREQQHQQQLADAVVVEVPVVPALVVGCEAGPGGHPP